MISTEAPNINVPEGRSAKLHRKRRHGSHRYDRRVISFSNRHFEFAPIISCCDALVPAPLVNLDEEYSKEKRLLLPILEGERSVLIYVFA